MSVVSGRGWRRLALAVFVVVALVPAAAFSVGTLDQQQTLTGADGSATAAIIDGPDLSGGDSAAQAFTAGLTGALDQVDLLLEQNETSGNTSVTVEIRDMASGVPASTSPLATTTIPASAIAAANSGGAFVSATFTTPASVVAGTQYAIVVYTSGSQRYRWHFKPAFANGDVDPYTGGILYVSEASPPSSGWTTDTNSDFAFKTYVTVSSTTAECNGQEVTVPGTPGDDELRGTSGADVFAGLGGNDEIRGRGGNDVICGGDGKDEVFGGSGSDLIYGEGGNDELSGGDGNDTLKGGEGNDEVSGGDGNDIVNGNFANDELSGGSGNDSLNGDDGADKLFGGSGKDALDGGNDSPDQCNGGKGTDSGGTGCETTRSIP